MKNIITILTMAFLVSCASTSTKQQTTLSSKDTCPENLSKLESLKTDGDVVFCLGNPVNTTSKEDGRNTKMYKFGGDITIVFLFDKDGNVIRHRAYQG